jgi:glycosyltransferase involved in cell wall biosynthesis
MTVRASIVVPVYNGGPDLEACLVALTRQSLPATDYEVIVVDDGSTDGSATLAERHGVRVIRQRQQGAPAARNAGLRAACGAWVAFTDADCVPSRRWLEYLLAAVAGRADAVGAAGTTTGLASSTPAARFVDLSGGLDPARYLAHARWPFAPTANVMYRREAVLEQDGFDERLAAYDACDLHTRLRPPPGSFVLAPRALVLHRHRATWRQYFRQQRNYGRGLAQFCLRHRGEVSWTAPTELRAWARLAVSAAACLSGKGDAALVRRGTFCKDLAQRLGFAPTFWSPAERRRWRADVQRPGRVQRLRRRIQEPRDVVLALRIGWFMWRLPRRMRALSVPRLLDGIRAAPRSGSGAPQADVERIRRLRGMWFGLPALAPYNTCFMRALTTYRFLDPGEALMRLHLVIEPGRSPGDRLRSHAWVTLEGAVIEEVDLTRDGVIRGLYSHPPARAARKAGYASAAPGEVPQGA